MKPLIGITCNASEKIVSKINQRIYNDLSFAYTNAIKEAGGIPLIIPNGLNKEDLEDLGDRLDGFLITGGVDVDPSCYGKEDDGTVGETTPVRDQAEIDLLHYIIPYTAKPVFGICRGIQIINVAMGGTLIMDLESAGKNKHSLTQYPRNEFSHEITVNKDSRLYELLKDERKVNSLHHQAIDILAEGLKVTARSKEDEVIEAVESTDGRYILAVQWHPEELIHNENHRRLFEELVRQACLANE